MTTEITITSPAIIEGETPSQRTKRLRKELYESQLKEDQRTASHKLNRLILISLLRETGRHTCCRCGEELNESTFSIDHMEHWLHSDDPRGKYFNIKNIDFSCKPCNSSYTRAKRGTAAYDERLQRITGWSARNPLLHRDEIFRESASQNPVQLSLWDRCWIFLTTVLQWGDLCSGEEKPKSNVLRSSEIGERNLLSGQ